MGFRASRHQTSPTLFTLEQFGIDRNRVIRFQHARGVGGGSAAWNRCLRICAQPAPVPRRLIGAHQTVGSQIPSTANASPSPGHGGMVVPTAVRDSGETERNWKWVPTGIVRATPGSTSTISS
jgi:hypothetical protein